MPNVENIQKWVDALRSGKYAQATEKLKTDVGYCCMGVASDLCGVGRWEFNERYGNWLYVDETGDEEVYPTLGVVEWLGLADADGEYDERTLTVNYKGEYAELAYLNDNEGLDFGHIADLIEAEWLR